MNKALFLDRDGVINVDHGYVYESDSVQFIDGLFELCRHAQHLGFRIIIVTNQSGIARGYYSQHQFYSLMAWMRQQFHHQRIAITGIYHCPHHPALTGACPCRKPKDGMLLKAIRDWHINPQKSLMIGDNESDMQAAKKASISRRLLLHSHQPKRQTCATAVINNHKCALQYLNHL